MVKKPTLKWGLFGLFFLGTIVNLGIWFTDSTFKHHGDEQVLMAAMETQPVEEDRVTPVVSARPVSQNAVFVHLEQDDRALILEGTLDNQENMKFILDTGATYTAISEEVAKKLGYDLDNAPHITITTANGPVSLARITIKSLTINGYTAHNVEATVMPMPPNVPFSGLLGLNYVKRHRITIDSEAEHLVIEPNQI